MITLVRREFTVDVPMERAWQHLARVEQWPSWAKHIRQVEVQPPGELGPNSAGILRLTNGVSSAFTMTEFNPYRNWKWAGGFLWLTVHYDHLFEELTPHQTKLTWVVAGEGFGVSVFGKVFAKVYAKNLDRAIPLLIAEMNSNRM
jgi:Polyketide cyclase / dehydrase and lipid transport